MFRNNKIKLDCYTYNKKLIDLQPLQTRKNNPPWWKKLKPLYKVLNTKNGIQTPTPTIKACPGIINYLRTPVVINLWADIIVKVFPDGRLHVGEPMHSAGQGLANLHDEKQYQNHIWKDRSVLKLIAPWHIVADKPVDFLLADPYYHTDDLRDNEVEVAPGVVSLYDQHTINVFLTFKRKEEPYEVYLKYNTPVMAMFPMTEKDIEIEMHYTDKNSWEDVCDIFPATFLGRYHTRKRAFKN